MVVRNKVEMKVGEGRAMEIEVVCTVPTKGMDWLKKVGRAWEKLIQVVRVRRREREDENVRRVTRWN